MTVTYYARTPKLIMMLGIPFKSTGGYGGRCPNANEIYLFGGGRNIVGWISTIVHEEFHILLYKLGIEVEYHHKIIDMINEVWDPQEL